VIATRSTGPSSTRVDHLVIEQMKIAPRSPWQNGHAERFLGTLRTRVARSPRRPGDRHLLRALSIKTRTARELCVHNERGADPTRGAENAVRSVRAQPTPAEQGLGLGPRARPPREPPQIDLARLARATPRRYRPPLTTVTGPRHDARPATLRHARNVLSNNGGPRLARKTGRRNRVCPLGCSARLGSTRYPASSDGRPRALCPSEAVKASCHG
jgi:hypothetical protein